LLGSKRGAQGEHAAYRRSEKIFLDGKVFNTSVDKLVEIKGTVSGNFPQFNILERFAQFVCKHSRPYAHSSGAGAFQSQKIEFREALMKRKKLSLSFLRFQFEISVCDPWAMLCDA
jgi:hypothetical protein